MRLMQGQSRARPLELPALFDDTLGYKTEARLSIDWQSIVFPHHLAQVVASMFRERNVEPHANSALPH